jgi:hypothetical protein
LATYNVWISEEIRPILQEVADEDVKNGGAELTLTRWDNSRQLLNKMMSAQEVKTVLFFLDTEHLQEEIERLLHFRDGVKGKKELWFNWSCAKWAQRQLDSVESTFGKNGMSTDDAVILIGEPNRTSYSEFIETHLDKLMHFKKRVVSPDVLESLVTNPPVNPGDLIVLPPQQLDLASNLVETYKNINGGADLADKFCNIVLCTTQQRLETSSVGDFLELSFNPVYRTNVMINLPSAEAWIDSLYPCVGRRN